MEVDKEKEGHGKLASRSNIWVVSLVRICFSCVHLGVQDDLGKKDKEIAETLKQMASGEAKKAEHAVVLTQLKEKHREEIYLLQVTLTLKEGT